MFIVSETSCLPWFMTPFSSLGVSSVAPANLPLCFPHHMTISDLPLLPPSHMATCDRAHWVPRKSLISEILNLINLPNPFCHVRSGSQVPGIKVWTSLGSQFRLPQVLEGARQETDEGLMLAQVLPV